MGQSIPFSQVEKAELLSEGLHEGALIKSARQPRCLSGPSYLRLGAELSRSERPGLSGRDGLGSWAQVRMSAFSTFQRLLVEEELNQEWAGG